MTMAETQVESGASGSGGGGGANGAGGGTGPPDAVTAAPLLHLHANNNHPLATNNNHRASKQRKRKRLSQVVDKLATQVSSGPTLPPLNNNFHHHNHNHKELDLLKLVKSEPDEDSLGEEAPEPRALKASKTLAAAVVAVAAVAAAAGRGPPEAATPPKEESGAADSVFRFDSTDRDRYLFNAISEEDEAEDVFSPASSSNKSPHSSNTDSPKISFSPLRLKDSSVEDELDGAASCTPPSSGRSAGGSSGGGGSSTVAVAAARGPHGPGEDAPRYPGCACAHCTSATDRFFPASPISPLTPVSPSPAPIYHFEHYLHTKYLPDIFRRRSHSDSDLPMWFEGAKAEGGAETTTTATPTTGGRAASRNTPQPLTLPAPAKGGSLESETSTPQDSPLDLSMKGSRERVGSSTSSESAPPPTPVLDPAATLAAAAATGTTPNAALQLQLLTPGFIPPGKTGSAMPVPVVKGDVASPTTKESVAVRYNLEVSPVVEEMPPGSDVAYVCPVCGQMFSLHDRLAKHMASRHKSRAQPDQSSKAYLCEICKRSFARSDMLTRHMRLHTGVKPYTCRICGQVFSRSDHLSTHQRTHTGEKPYRCPQCPYAACRRDMITRHMRTHARYEPGVERPERGRRGRRGGRGRGRGGSRDGGVTDLPPDMTDPGVALDDMGDLPLTDDLLPPDCISPEPPLSPAQGLGSMGAMSPMDTGGHHDCD